MPGYNIFTMFLWIIGGIFCFLLLWGVGSYCYLKLRFRHLSSVESLNLLVNLDKEESKRQAKSS
jgi:hypothetical protein